MFASGITSLLFNLFFLLSCGFSFLHNRIQSIVHGALSEERLCQALLDNIISVTLEFEALHSFSALIVWSMKGKCIHLVLTGEVKL